MIVSDPDPDPTCQVITVRIQLVGSFRIRIRILIGKKFRIRTFSGTGSKYSNWLGKDPNKNFMRKSKSKSRLQLNILTLKLFRIKLESLNALKSFCIAFESLQPSTYFHLFNKFFNYLNLM